MSPIPNLLLLDIHHHVLIFILVSTLYSTGTRSNCSDLSTAPPVDPTAPTFFPTSAQTGELFGELEPKDTEWLCAGGFTTETQTFYNVLENGTLVMVQIIHSAIGLVPATHHHSFGFGPTFMTACGTLRSN